jgi:hypothetical protein
MTGSGERALDRALAELERDGKLQCLKHHETGAFAWLEADRPIPRGFDPAPRRKSE